ncbi:MAG: PfkB family carbohydrate kinase [Pseudonocardiales bacterium]|nr:PfkB family carbohydrate kinase [Pseudonocardiales bacterium]
MRIVHVGTVVVDLVAAVPALPGRGGDVVASSLAPSPGGGFNVLAAVARRGARVAYAGPHGSGPFGDLVRAALAGLGVAVLAAPRAADTGLVVTLVDGGGERTFVTSPDALVGPTADDLARARPVPGDTVSVSGYGLLHPPSRDALVPWVRALPAGVTVLLDPGPLAPAAAPDALADLLPRVDWLTANRPEATALAGPASAGESSISAPAPAPVGGADAPGLAGATRLAAALARRTGHGVVVRDGSAGCVVVPPGGTPVAVPGFAVDAVDTTGAGDAHTGVLAVELSRGADPASAARTANAAAALTVTRPGPATSPSARDLAAFLARHP